MDINGGGADLTAKYQVLIYRIESITKCLKFLFLIEACHRVCQTASPVCSAEKRSSGRTREESKSSRSGLLLCRLLECSMLRITYLQINQRETSLRKGEGEMEAVLFRSENNKSQSDEDYDLVLCIFFSKAISGLQGYTQSFHS